MATKRLTEGKRNKLTLNTLQRPKIMSVLTSSKLSSFKTILKHRVAMHNIIELYSHRWVSNTGRINADNRVPTEHHRFGWPRHIRNRQCSLQSNSSSEHHCRLQFQCEKGTKSVRKQCKQC